MLPFRKRSSASQAGEVPQLCSFIFPGTNGEQRERKPASDAGGSTPIPELYIPGGRESLATPGLADGDSALMGLLSDISEPTSPPAQLDPAMGP